MEILEIKSNIIDVCAGLVRSYLDQKSTNSLRMLSQNTGIHRNTLTKLKDGTCTLSLLDPIKVKKLISIVAKEDSETILNSIREELSEEIENKYKPYSAHKLIDSNDKIDENASIDNVADYFTFIRCANTGGASLDEIVKDFGYDTLKSIEKLLKLKVIVTNEDGRFVTNKNEEIEYYTRETVKKYQKDIIGLYKLSNAGKELNYIQSIFQSLNMKGIQALRSEYEKFIENSYKIISDPDFKGDIPYFYTGAMDTFKNENIKQSEAQQ